MSWEEPPPDPMPPAPAPRPLAAATVSPESPWLGLSSFSEETRAYFFGRGAEVQDLHERIVHKPLTVLFGQSGLGKTSLLQAALVPLLRGQGYLPVVLRLEHTPAAPPLERQVISALYAAMGPGPGIVPDGMPDDGVRLWLLFHDPEFGFVGDAAPRYRPVFIFDQFEEIFTLGERPERREDSLRFRDALACLIENRAPESVRQRVETDDALADRLIYEARPAKVLLTLRDDFLHVLERWRRQMPSLMDNRLELRLLNGNQALQAVVAPGNLRGPGHPPIVSPETGAAIVRFVAGTGDEVPLAGINAVPPLLSLICSELNARRFGSDGVPREETIQPDQLRGRSEDILYDFYRNSFQDVPAAVRNLVEDRLLSADGFRESLSLDSAHRLLENEGMDAAGARRALGWLVDRRLLVVEERGGVRRIELTHDVLTAVARQSRDARAALQAAARAEQERAAAARVAEQRRLIRRTRTVGAGFALLAFLSLGALSWALVQREAARREGSRAEAAGEKTSAMLVVSLRQVHQACLADLGAAKSALGRGSWSDAVTYLRRAQTYHDPDSRLATSRLWHEIVYGGGDRDCLPQFYLPQPDEVELEYSPDGKSFFTIPKAGAPGAAGCLWDTATGRPLGDPVPGACHAVYGPDGARVFLYIYLPDEKRGWVQSMETTTGKLAKALPLQCPGPGRLVCSLDGLHLLAQTYGDVEKNQPDRVQLCGTDPERPETRMICANRFVKEFLFDPDGKRVLVAYGDTALAGSAQQWDVATGQPVGRVMRHDQLISSAFYSPDGKRILTASHDRTARQWDAATGAPFGEIMRHEDPLNKAVYDFTGARIMAVSNRKVSQWDTASGKPAGEIFLDVNTGGDARYSPDGTRILVNFGDRVQEWDAITRESRSAVRCDSTVYRALYSPDGTRVLTLGTRGMRQWEADTGRPIGELMGRDFELARAIYSFDGAHVLALAAAGGVYQWETIPRAAVGEPVFFNGFTGDQVAYNPHDDHLLAVSLDEKHDRYRIDQFDTSINSAAGRPIGELMHTGKGEEVGGVAYDPKGAHILVVTNTGDEKSQGTVRQWHASSGQPGGEAMLHGDAIASAVYRPDGTRILTASADHTARQWDAATGKPIGEALRHDGAVVAAVYSPDGTRILTASADRTARQWDAATGKPLGATMRQDDPFTSASYNRDGTRILTVCAGQDGPDPSNVNGTIRQWDAATGKPLGEPIRQAGRIVGAAYGPDGASILACCGDISQKKSVHALRVWEAATGRLLTETDYPQGTPHLVYSPDAKRLLVFAPQDERKGEPAQEWDAGSLASLGRIEREDQPVNHAFYSHDGARFFTVSGNLGQQWLTTPPSFPTVPEWFDDFVQAVSGRSLNAGGEIEILPMPERMVRRDRVLAAVTRAGVNGTSWDGLARWALMLSSKRSIHPGSALTIEGFVNRVRSDNHEEANRQALLYAPGSRLVWLEKTRFETNPAAAAFLRKYALDHLPDDAVTGVSAAQILRGQDQPDLALALARRVAADHPEDPAALRQVAECLAMDLDRPAEALPVYERLTEPPGAANAEDLARMGGLCIDLGQVDRGRELLRQALLKSPHDPEVCCIEGWALLTQNLPGDARAAFQRGESLSSPPGLPPPDVFCGEAAACWIMGDKTGATQACKFLIANAGDYAAAKRIADHVHRPDAQKNALLASLAEMLRVDPAVAGEEAAGFK